MLKTPLTNVKNTMHKLLTIASLTLQLPKARPALEERFNVSFNNVPAQQFFRSIVAGTRYNILVHPDVSGTITANLKDVTLQRRWTRCARCTATTTRSKAPASRSSR
jgi:type II secretory pathway component HofQ